MLGECSTRGDSVNHPAAEFRPISGLPHYNPIYYWLAVSAQYSPNDIIYRRRRRVSVKCLELLLSEAAINYIYLYMRLHHPKYQYVIYHL